MVSDFRNYSNEKLVNAYDELTSLLRSRKFRSSYPITTKQLHRLRMMIIKEIRERNDRTKKKIQ